MCHLKHIFVNYIPWPGKVNRQQAKKRIFMQDAQRSDLRFTGQHALVILIVPPQQRRRIQTVGAF